ncbi:hypothetical protein [Micromonospora sp. RP3T]|uniref:hypothetical protein n=1 Tax=Micromonospora sp. RP3T TaxID=2135446 RepID=UPI003D719AA7
MQPYFWLVDGGTVGTNMHLAFTVDPGEDVAGRRDVGGVLCSRAQGAETIRAGMGVGGAGITER